MQYIYKLNINKLGEYKNKVLTDRVIFTSERRLHVKNKHPKDFENNIDYINIILNNPNYILLDNDYENTILILKSIKDNNKNIEIVVKLHTNTEDKMSYNSILTFWSMRNRSYQSIIKNNKIIYSKFDNFK